MQCEAITSKGKRCIRNGRLEEIPLLSGTIWLCGLHYHALYDVYDDGTIDDIEELLKSWSNETN